MASKIVVYDIILPRIPSFIMAAKTQEDGNLSSLQPNKGIVLYIE